MTVEHENPITGVWEPAVPLECPAPFQAAKRKLAVFALGVAIGLQFTMLFPVVVSGWARIFTGTVGE